MGGIVQKSKEKIKKLKTNHEAKIIKHQNKEGNFLNPLTINKNHPI